MSEPTSVLRRLLRLVFHVSLALLGLVVVIGLWGYVVLEGLIERGPVLDLERLKLTQNIRILDREGGELYAYFDSEDRVSLAAGQIPDTVRNAVVAIEDERFYDRAPCIDARAVLRALKANYWDNAPVQGGSTITQQLVRTLYLTREKTFTRKFYEVVLACHLERVLSREQILTLYLNGVSFGGSLSGIEQASRAYFSVPGNKLSVAQAATLAGLIQRPTYFSPYGPHRTVTVHHRAVRELRSGEKKPRELDAADVSAGLLPRVVTTPQGLLTIPGRATLVLDSMRRRAFIDDSMYEAASRDLLRLKFRSAFRPIAAPHFALAVKAEINSLVGSFERPDRLKREGITVRTTLDPAMQFIAESAIEHAAPILVKAQAKNAAVIVLDRRSRAVIAYVGNTDFFGDSATGQIDMAATPRQPGSSFKPLVYAAAFESGYGPETFIEDTPLSIGTDQPKNYDGGYHGWISIRKALGGSRNIPAVRAFLYAGGEDAILSLADAVGMPTLSAFKRTAQQADPHFAYGWPMSIGSAEVPLTEMVELYATIADHGRTVPLKTICSVSDTGGQPLIGLPLQLPVQAISTVAAAGVDSILRDPDSRPAGYWREILTIPGRNTAAKTGTSNLCFTRDWYGKCTRYGVGNVWAFGYDDRIVVGVWVGNADGTGLDPLADGLTVAVPIWSEILTQSEQMEPVEACG